MVAIKTANGDFSVFEMIGNDHFEKGDQVSWTDDTSCGHTTIRNITKGELIEVFFENHWVHISQLRQQLRYP